MGQALAPDQLRRAVIEALHPQSPVVRTIKGDIAFVELRDQVMARAGLVLTVPSAPAWKRELLGGGPPPEIVSLHELQRQGLFPRPAGKPGRYHRDAVSLVLFLAARLGLRHPQDDPRRIARGRLERDALRRELTDRWSEMRRHTDCERWEKIIRDLEEAAADEGGRTQATLLRLAGEAREDLHQQEVDAEYLFYSWAGVAAKGAQYRTEARGRDLKEVIDEQIVVEARNALRLRRRDALLDEIDLQKREVRVTYVLRPGPDGQPTTSLEPPTVQVARRRTPRADDEPM